MVAIDLGARTSKAIYLQRKGAQFSLINFALLDAPVSEKAPSAEVLADHLGALVQALDAKTKRVILIVGPNDSLLRHAELPQVPISDMRMMLKFNAKNYLQQELTDFIFDCFVLPSATGVPPAEAGKPAQKTRVLVGAAKKQFVDGLQDAARSAGLMPDQIIPGLIGPANAFELAQPEVFSKEIVALVDIGFKNSTITILLNGELILSRVVGIGGDRLTNGLAEAMGISYAEAEGIKIGMPAEVQGNLQPMLSSLGRELRASIDFFEHQKDKAVSQAFVSGGSSSSEFILQSMQSELMVPCKGWNPTSFLQLALPPKQMSEIEQIAPQLAVAVGGAAAAM
jgi:type IV pilus assembly protein PilM